MAFEDRGTRQPPRSKRAPPGEVVELRDTAHAKKVFTLGTSTRTREEFLAVLQAWGIRRVCDVRSFPTSRRYPHFSREALSTYLEAHGVDYRFLGGLLGGYRKGGYQAHMQTPDFKSGMEELERAAAETPTAVVCAELLPWKCHRRFIARALEERGWKVVHVIDARRSWTPRRNAPQPALYPDEE